jgi:hypothetical protein
MPIGDFCKDKNPMGEPEQHIGRILTGEPGACPFATTPAARQHLATGY